MSKIVFSEVVLDADTILPLLKRAAADDQAIYEEFGPVAGYLINVIARTDPVPEIIAEDEAREAEV